jgi:hypothetical protein
MSEQKYAVTLTIYATVTVHDPEVIERVTGPGGGEWRGQFYRTVESAEDVVEHFVFNAVTNGIYDIGELDGWADVVDSADAVKIEFDASDFSTEAVA